MLRVGEYMIVITGYQRVGTLMQNCDILRATAFQILPIARNTNGLSSQQLDDEQTFIYLLQKHLKKNGFYFSYRYNLTLSVQKQAQIEGDVNNWREVGHNSICAYEFILKNCVGRYEVLLESLFMSKVNTGYSKLQD